MGRRGSSEQRQNKPEPATVGSYNGIRRLCVCLCVCRCVCRCVCLPRLRSRARVRQRCMLTASCFVCDRHTAAAAAVCDGWMEVAQARGDSEDRRGPGGRTDRRARCERGRRQEGVVTCSRFLSLERAAQVQSKAALTLGLASGAVKLACTLCERPFLGDVAQHTAQLPCVEFDERMHEWGRSRGAPVEPFVNDHTSAPLPWGRGAGVGGGAQGFRSSSLFTHSSCAGLYSPV
eukprot:1605227-Rhodomonas_salina.1